MHNRIRGALCAALALPVAGCAELRLPIWDDSLYQQTVADAEARSSSWAPPSGPKSITGPPTAISSTRSINSTEAPQLLDGELSLDEATQLALANHPDLRRAGFAVQAAAGRELQAGLYPNPAFVFEGESLGADAGDGGETAYLLEQELVTSGKREKSRSVAAADRLLEQSAFRATAFDLLTRVRVAYAAAVASERRLAAERELLDLADELLAAAETQVDAGAATEPDRLRAQVVREQASIDLRTAESEALAARQALATAVGSEAALEARLVDALASVPVLPSQDEAVALVLERNTSAEQARLAIERATRAHKLARARAIPNVVAAVGPRYSDPESETTLDVGLSVAIPLFDRNQGEIAAALAERIAAGAALGAVRLALIEAVSTAWASYESARYAVELYSASLLPKAEATLELTREAYRAGKTDYLRLLDAQQTLVRSRLAYVDALASLHEAAAILEGLMQRSAPWQDSSEQENAP